MLSKMLVAAALCGVASGADLAPTPPMGWMSWEIFRCEVDCVNHNESCINEYLYKTMTDELVSGGYLAAGYNGIHLDDCWMRKTPPRDSQGRLFPDPQRFPSGFQALGDYMHQKGVKFAVYTAESATTCAGYPASKGYEKIDADTFASWGVDYVKVDGCGDAQYYPTGYPLMGNSLVNSSRDIVYSCSWPAYLGNDETKKPYEQFIAAHCNLWRNWADIQCNWNSLSSIIEHWGEYGSTLQKYAAPGHWNDPDMLLIGNTCITEDEARTQMAIWSISAAPLIMGNDLRIVPDAHKTILLNAEAIAVDQDKLGKMGIRISTSTTGQVWARQLSDGWAVALYNPSAATAKITFHFSSVGITTAMNIRDLWAHKDLGSFNSAYTTTVPTHGTAFIKLTSA
eukprot:TRINITY_DN621_c0_g2_i2.p1 TRINITY_DN621_c0_g2~~TRINITY_DN621_c0_g2_i2.p1  ORF type:complete len:397 (+),score=118.11 TRINITY_DN621_c0_g2_i2:48-1238(+)